LSVPGVPGETGANIVRVARRRRSIRQLVLNERRSAVEWREVDSIDRRADAEQRAEGAVSERTLNVAGEPCAISAVAVEIARRPVLERRVVRGRVAESVIGERELLLAARVGSEAPWTVGARRRVEEERVVAPTLRRQKDSWLDGPAVG